MPCRGYIIGAGKQCFCCPAHGLEKHCSFLRIHWEGSHHIFLTWAQLNTAALPTHSETREGLNIEISLEASYSGGKLILNNAHLHCETNHYHNTPHLYANLVLHPEEYQDESKLPLLPDGKPLPLSLSRISLLRSGRDSLSVSRPSS